MGAFDALSFWREPDFRGRVGWYREVAADRLPEAPVNIMDQYHPDNYCDPANDKFMERYRPFFQ